MHIPVLKKEVLQYLDPKPNENFIDCTINGGGHARDILDRIKPQGKVLGIELDKDIFHRLSLLKLERLILVNDSYVNLEKIVKENKFSFVKGILFDLGISSWQLMSGRGFTFMKDEPLDMRYSTNNDLTAEHIVNNWSETELVNILEKYGEERFAKKIAKNIIINRPIKTTFQLVKAIKGKGGRIHPATRTFQALRITVNRELESLEKALPQAEKILAPGGRMAVISFHSLEDRIVKNFFKKSSLNPVRDNGDKKEISEGNRISNGMKILFKKPIRASREEIKTNHRSRSAKLRIAEKI